MLDKSTMHQVLGALMQKPQLLSQVDKYSFTLNDFNGRFEKYIYSAILGLYHKNALHIEPIDIENYLQADTVAAKTFEMNNGIEFLQDIVEFSSADNFDYYYSKLKKLNLLRDLKKQGFDTSEFYQEDLTKNNAEDINHKFEDLTSADICQAIKTKLLVLESSYAKSAELVVENAADGIRDFVSHLNDTIEVGVSVQGHIYNKIINGAMRGALTIRSAGSGVGKTRMAVADACYLAYPIHYDGVKHQWVQHGSSEKVLFIVTEQTFEQVRKMMLAYLTDLNESRFKFGNFNEEEMKLINVAIELIERYSDNFILVKMPNPTIELVKATIREACLTRQIDHVFYDYIFIGPALLNEFRGFTLRNDEVLLMFATALKDLAVELNVSMFTSTQVNASADDNKNIRNESGLAGGRATINKADNGAIMARPTSDELEILDPLIKKYGKPNVVTDIFKVRSGEWTQVRIWSEIDLGRLKRKDLFLTDARLDAIDGFFNEDEAYEIHHWDTTEMDEIMQLVNELNKKG